MNAAAHVLQVFFLSVGYNCKENPLLKLLFYARAEVYFCYGIGFCSN